MPSTLQDIFDRIYEDDAWGGGSGPGSDPIAAAEYIRFVNYMIEILRPKTFLDVGCGDCRLASKFNLRGAKYTGIDVSRRAIDLARTNMPEGTELIVGEWSMHSCRSADMAHCKDVMQHLSHTNAMSLHFQLTIACSRVIVCNDFADTTDASKMSDGGYCPFNIKGLAPSLDFTIQVGDHLKQVAVC